MTTPNYKPKTPISIGIPSGRDNVSPALAAACRLAGVEAPNRAAELAQIIGNPPDPNQVARTLIEEGFEAEDLTNWHKDAQKRLNEAHQAHILADAYKTIAGPLARRQYPTVLAGVTDALTARFDEAVQTLTEAADALPATDPIGDLEAVMATHATREREIAIEALGNMSTIASAIPHTVDANDHLPGAAVIAIDIPDLDHPLRVPAGHTDRTLTTADQDTISRLLRDFHHNPDAALINTARCMYGPARLNLATTPADFHARLERYRRATTSVHASRANTSTLELHGVAVAGNTVALTK